MKKLSAALGVTAALAFATPASATNGMRMIGFGPVQNSMGGASAAAPLDTATAISNPAGLSALGKRADLSGTYFAPTVKFLAKGAGTGGELTSDRGASYIPTLGFSWSTLENLTLGVGASGTSGMGVDYKADLFSNSVMTSYSNMRVAPAASYQLMKGLSAGVALNLMWAQMEWEAGGMYKRDAQSAFGYGATVGLQYTPVGTPAEMLTVGVAYETKSDFQDFEWDIPSNTIMTPMGPFTVPGGKETLEFDQPQVLTFGAAVRPLPILLVAADVQWINWSATNGKDLPKYAGENEMTTGSQDWNLNWDDQVVLKLGAQVEAMKDLKVRAGYNYAKSPLDKSRAFENIAFPAIAESHYTFGVGYDYGKFSVNAAAVYVPESVETGADLSMGITSYTTKMSQLAFDLGVAYRM